MPHSHDPCPYCRKIPTAQVLSDVQVWIPVAEFRSAQSTRSMKEKKPPVSTQISNFIPYSTMVDVGGVQYDRMMRLVEWFPIRVIIVYERCFRCTVLYT